MAYIGREPQIGNFQVCDAISVVNGQAAYTMQVDSVNVFPETANHCLVSLNGVLQKSSGTSPSFTISGSTITFASNLVTGDVINFIHILGSVLDLGVPSDSTVTNAKTNFVSTSSAAGLQIKGDGTTDGTLQLNCSQNSHGIKLKSPAHSASASYTLTFPVNDGDANQFLQTNGSGVLSFADAGGGKVLQVITAEDGTTRTTTSTSFATGSNTLSVDITPAATSSKIFVVCHTPVQNTGSSENAMFSIFRDSTNLGDSSSGLAVIAPNVYQNITMTFLDSPSSTSQLTYQVYMKGTNGNTAKVAANGPHAVITAFEIGA